MNDIKINIKRTGNRNLSKGLSTISCVWRKEADPTGGRVSVLSRVLYNRIFGHIIRIAASRISEGGNPPGMNNFVLNS